MASRMQAAGSGLNISTPLEEYAMFGDGETVGAGIKQGIHRLAVSAAI